MVVAEARNARVRLVTREGLVTTLAGSGEKGFLDGSALEARFNFPVAVAVDPNGVIYVADAGNGLVRVIMRTTSP